MPRTLRQQQKKVLHVIDSLGVGGAERLLAVLGPEFQRQGYSMTVAVARAPYDLQGELELLGIQVHRLPVTFKWRLLSHATSLARLCKQEGIGIVHAHLYFAAIYVSVAKSLGLLSVKTVVTFHNLVYDGTKETQGLGGKLKKWLACVFYRVGFGGFTAVSAAAAAHYAKHLHLPMPVVINNPINIAAIEKITANHEYSLSATPRLVLPGRLVVEKGHQVLVEAVGLLEKQGHVLQIEFVGGGPLESSLVSYIHKSKLRSLFTITGVVPHEEMLAKMRKADVVVVPSVREGFGLTALEPQALARPVVASSVGGLSELVVDDKTGLLVEPNNPELLADTIASLLVNQHLRQRLAEASRKAAMEDFDLAIQVASYISLYEQ